NPPETLIYQALSVRLVSEILTGCAESAVTAGGIKSIGILTGAAACDVVDRAARIDLGRPAG
ncbi:hypothetical protein, partial [Micromonospora sp. CB01531]|uniref:hypothetical protein n=1 Tax=Micromonospora sp. CB01531 TaxID=1718947 RepID=UPI001A7E04DA